MLGDEIGKGAYGRVYKGLDLENGDFVAIKQVSLENIPQEDLNVIMVGFLLFLVFLPVINHSTIYTSSPLSPSKSLTSSHHFLLLVNNDYALTLGTCDTHQQEIDLLKVLNHLHSLLLLHFLVVKLQLELKSKYRLT